MCLGSGDGHWLGADPTQQQPRHDCAWPTTQTAAALIRSSDIQPMADATAMKVKAPPTTVVTTLSAGSHTGHRDAEQSTQPPHSLPNRVENRRSIRPNGSADQFACNHIQPAHSHLFALPEGFEPPSTV